MSDEEKTKKQLIDELIELRRRDAERSRVEAQLQESENRYRTIIENMLDVAYTCSADGTITYISPQACSLGDSPEAVVGHNIMEFVHPDDADRVLADMQRTMQTGEEFPTVFRLINPDGEVFYVEETGKVIRDGEQIVGITGTLRDVSQRMEMEEELKAERNKVQQYLDISGVIIVAIDADRKVSLINKKGCEVLGHGAD